MRAGRYKKLSASLYSPSSPANPRPGTWYLRHVGFLGAQPPAIKGLAPVNFAAGDEEGTVTVEFSEEMSFISRLVGLLRGVRDYITERDGADKAEAALPAWTLDSLQEGSAVAQALPVPEPGPGFSEPEPNKEDEPGQSLPMRKRKPNLPAGNRSLPGARPNFPERGRRAEAETFIGTAVTEGRLTPAQSAGLADFMASLPAEGVFEFAEGDGKKRTSPAAFMKEFISRLPKQVDFSEKSAPSDADDPDELDPREAAARAVAFQERRRAAGIVVTTTEAMAAVKAGKDKE